MTFEPTWRRLVATTLVCFALVLAVLAWRVHAGADPALGRPVATATTSSATSSSAAPPSSPRVAVPSPATTGAS